MSAGKILLWIIIPYVAMTVFVVGHWWRYRRDQFDWTSRSTQLLDRRILGLGQPDVPLRRARRRRRPPHRPRASRASLTNCDRHHRARLPLDRRDRRRDRRRRHADRVPGPGLPADHHRPGPAQHHSRRPPHLPAADRADRPGLLDDLRSQPRSPTPPTTTASRSGFGGAPCSTSSPTSPPPAALRWSTSCTRSSPGCSGHRSRSAASCTPGASRCSTSAVPTSSTAAASRPHADAGAAGPAGRPSGPGSSIRSPRPPERWSWARGSSRSRCCSTAAAPSRTSSWCSMP